MTLKFSGRVGTGTKTKPLSAGSYVLSGQGKSLKGTGKAVTAKFTIVKS